jgi:hypothetical protein
METSAPSLMKLMGRPCATEIRSLPPSKSLQRTRAPIGSSSLWEQDDGRAMPLGRDCHYFPFLGTFTLLQDSPERILSA